MKFDCVKNVLWYTVSIFLFSVIVIFELYDLTARLGDCDAE